MRVPIKSWNGLTRLVLVLIVLAVINQVRSVIPSNTGSQICYLIDGLVICSSVQ